MIEYLQRYWGYCLCNSIKEQSLLFFWGSGSNGKSVLTETLLNMFGDYGLKADNVFLTNSTKPSDNDRKQQITALLRNKRIVIFSELNSNTKLDEGLIKENTGSKTQTSRRLYKSYETFEATHKVIIEGNYKPIIRGTDWGIWRRIKIVKFGKIFGAEEIDRNLTDKLLAEKDGIFAWILEGYRKWRSEGLGEEPESMRMEINEYRSDSDVLGQFIEERLVQTEESWEFSGDIYQSYLAWLTINGYDRKVTKRKLTSELESRGFNRDNSNNRKPKFIGVKLFEQEEELASSM